MAEDTKIKLSRLTQPQVQALIKLPEDGSMAELEGEPSQALLDLQGRTKPLVSIGEPDADGVRQVHLTEAGVAEKDARNKAAYKQWIAPTAQRFAP